jgi:hypothetical protein
MDTQFCFILIKGSQPVFQSSSNCHIFISANIHIQQCCATVLVVRGCLVCTSTAYDIKFAAASK